MRETVGSLEAANSGIVESIQTISAITEEVSAHSNETYEACERNSGMVTEVTGIVEGLNEETKKIKAGY
jgi:methyl-accepting chemotaxis protein